MLLAVLQPSQKNLALAAALEHVHSSIKRIDSFGSKEIALVLNGKVKAMIVDCAALTPGDAIITQALLGISNILPTVYINHTEDIRRGAAIQRPACATFVTESEPEPIVEALVALLNRREHKGTALIRGIPVFEKHYALQHLKEGAGLSVLAIDATSLATIEARFGKQAFDDSVQFFQALLTELWGTSGSFRTRDILCRHNDLNLTYIIILEANRTVGRLPPPGSLEKVADRVQVQIDNRLWQALAAHQGPHSLPRGMNLIPEIRVGYSSAAESMLEDDDKLVDRLVHEAIKSTALQQKRMYIRRKEYLHNIIAAAGSLRPSFQAVFQLQGLTHSAVEESRKLNAIGPLSNLLFGFESLIRAQKDVITEIMGSSQLFTLDPSLLRPDVLFTLAKTVQADLELDLRAMRQALAFGTQLPGKLMINILPRNFYNLKKIRKNFPHDSRIIFEVSESEAIENFDLVQEVRADLRSMNIGVATDDFGRDYGGLERIFKIQPDIIKLDRALISNIHLDPPRLAFVSGLVQSVRVIGAMTLAEGVELWEEAETLQAIGVELVQGYLLHRPQEAAVVLASLQTGVPPISDDSASSSGAKVIPLKAG